MNAKPDAPSHRPSIDPRLAARRVMVARQNGRKRLRYVVAAGIVVGILVIAALVARSPLLAVDNVQVAGAIYTDPATLAAVVDDMKGTPMLSVDVDRARATLEASPWVKRASITRSWPKTIHVDVVERRPAASFVGPDNQYRVLDDEGRVLAVLPGLPTDYKTIVPAGNAFGPGPALAAGATAPSSLAAAARLAATLPDELRNATGEVGLDGEGNLSLALKPAGVILLGPPDGMRDKLIAALAILHKVDPAGITTLDVRVPEKPTCAPETTCAASLTPGTS